MDFAAPQDPDAQIRQSYPIRSRVYGWYFRVEELPTGYWQVKGRDRHGNKVVRVGDNPDDVLNVAENAAIELNDNVTWT